MIGATFEVKTANVAKAKDVANKDIAPFGKRFISTHAAGIIAAIVAAFIAAFIGARAGITS